MTKHLDYLLRSCGRGLAALLVLIGVGSAVAADPAPWRALYAGNLGTEEVIVDLQLMADDVAHARLLLNGRELVLFGTGTVVDDNAIEIDLAVDAGQYSPSIALLYLALPNMDETKPTIIGHLSGTLNPTWQDDGATLDLVLTLPDATLSAAIPRVAQQAYLRLDEGRLEAGAAWPRFGAPALRVVANSLEAQAYDQVSTFIAEGRSYVDDDGLGWGWTNDDYVDVLGAAGNYLSLLTSSTNYTGGAHPNSFYTSALYEIGPDGASVVDLEDLFAEGTDWQTAVLALVTADLLRQEAVWIENGTAVAVSDLATFGLGPDGLTFVFDPYAMGPYVQGAFIVTLPYSELTALMEPRGALAAFADHLPAHFFR